MNKTLSAQYEDILEQEKKLVAQIWKKLENTRPFTIPYSDLNQMFTEIRIEHKDLGLKEITTFEDIIVVISDNDGNNPIKLKIDRNYPSVRENSTGLRLIVIDKLAKHFNLTI